MSKNVPDAARDLVAHFEKLELDAYQCPAGKWTIGYGHTFGVVKGMSITADYARRLLEQDLGLYGGYVSLYVKAMLNENQRAALISFAYNIGSEAFRTSTLVAKLNQGDIKGAVDEFPKWVKAKGKVLPGLVRRREAELRLFLS